MNIEKRIQLLKEYLNLSKYEFIPIRILKRRKDNPELSKSVKQLKVYYMTSISDLEEMSDSIRKICDENNARAYIRLNRQNWMDCSLRCIEFISENIRKKTEYLNQNVWDSVAGQYGANDYWILDMDEMHLNITDSLVQDIQDHYKERGSDYRIKSNPTKSGVHLICIPFDTRILSRYNTELSKEGLQTIQIQKDANTIFYVGNSCEIQK